MMGERKVLGQSADVSLPQFGINSISAKVDTGAYRCRLHCDEASRCSDGKIHFTINGKKFVRDSYKPKMRVLTKSITGHEKREYAIMSNMIVNGKKCRTDIVLTDRNGKVHQALIGRKLLLDYDFVVDVRKGVENDVEYNNERVEKL